MRVLYFTDADSPHDQRFLAGLAETPHQVFALRRLNCEPDTPRGIEELAWPFGQPDWSDWQGWQAGKQKFSDLIKKIQPDLVHAGPIQGPAMLTAMAGFHPLVSMSWGFDLLLWAKRSPWMGCATEYTLQHTDVFLADCQTVVDEAARFGIRPDQTVRFPWGVDLEHFSRENGWGEGQSLRSSLGWQDHFVILCNRSWAPKYGVDLLARAFVDAVKTHKDLRLLLVGGGVQSDEIRRILSPVEQMTYMPGWLSREELPAAYCGADLFISPSHCDGSSVSLLEALACSCPVLVSDIPSNREWVTSGETGELFVDGHQKSLVDHILAMAKDPNLAWYGKQARILAESRADWQLNFEKLLMAYQMAVR